MLWKYIIKPILFSINPEAAHHLTFGLLNFAFRIPGVKSLFYRIFQSKYNHPIILFGLKFKNPVGLAAGLDKDGKYIIPLASLGFSHIEIGTVTPKPQPGNDKPRLFRILQDQALINRMGFNNEGAEAMATRLQKLDKPKDLILGINIGKNKTTSLEDAWKDYVACFELLHPYADYFTINISSPNTPGLRGLQDKEPLLILLNAVQTINKKLIHPKPILLKIAPDLEDLQLKEIKQIAIETGMSAVIMGNTTLDRTNLKTNASIINQIGAGGLSGAPLRNKSNHALAELKKEMGTIPLIGVGGILHEADAKEKIKLGADLIQVYTGFIYRGPGFVKSILETLN